MRIDLFSSNAFHLRMQGLLTSEANLADVAKQAVPSSLDHADDFFALAGYRKNHVPHWFDLRIATSEEQNHLYLNYHRHLNPEQASEPDQETDIDSLPRELLRATSEIDSLFSSEQFSQIASNFRL